MCVTLKYKDNERKTKVNRQPSERIADDDQVIFNPYDTVIYIVTFEDK